MNPDLVVYLTLVTGALLGFVLGRLERKESYTETYRYGFSVGKRVGQAEALNASEAIRK